MASKRKLCFYNHTGKVSGAERVLFAILSGLDGEEYEAVVFAPQSQDFEAFCKSHQISYRPVSALAARYTWNPWKLFRYLRSFAGLIGEVRQGLKSENAQFIHANTARSGIVATLATAGS